MNAISYMNIAIISSYDNCFINVMLCNTMSHVVPCCLPRVGQRRELQLSQNAMLHSQATPFHNQFRSKSI